MASKKNHRKQIFHNIPPFAPQTKTHLEKPPHGGVRNFLEAAAPQFNTETIDSAAYLAPICFKESIKSCSSTDSVMTDNTMSSGATDQTYIEPIYQEILPEA